MSIYVHVYTYTPLTLTPPHRSTLQSQFNVLSASLASVSTILTQHFPPPQENPSALVSYPLPSFPAQSQSILLSMLCNKKPNPLVQDWFVKGLNDPAVTALSTADKTEQDEFWKEVQDAVAEQQDSRSWYDELYTLEEREGEGGIDAVDTGLVLDERGDPVRREEREREKEKEKVGGGLRLDSMFRFMETGVHPRDQPPLPTGLPPGLGMMKR